MAEQLWRQGVKKRLHIRRDKRGTGVFQAEDLKGAHAVTVATGMRGPPAGVRQRQLLPERATDQGHADRAGKDGPPVLHAGRHPSCPLTLGLRSGNRPGPWLMINGDIALLLEN